MKRSAPFLALLAALASVAAATAATSVTVNATVNAGSTLSVAANGTASFSLTLNGADQTTSYTLPVSVVDARGLAAGGGWNLTVTSTSFSDGSGHSFPATASTITGISTTCGSGSTCTPPTNSVVNSNLALPAGAAAPAPVKFENAANATGLGTTNLAANVQVGVPANTFAGTYSSTVTVAVVAGP